MYMISHPSEFPQMIFENPDMICEIAKHMDGNLSNMLMVNKELHQLKQYGTIKDYITTFYNNKATIIQDRFRKYIDKLDFIDGISENGNISLARLNSFLDDEFCLVDKYYLTYGGYIGTLLLDIGATYTEMSIYNGAMYQQVQFDTLLTYKSILNKYLV
jgi:hypothetical protein